MGPACNVGCKRGQRPLSALVQLLFGVFVGLISAGLPLKHPCDGVSPPGRWQHQCEAVLRLPRIELCYRFPL